DRDAHADLLAAPVHAVGEAQYGEGVPPYRLLPGERGVRDGHALPDVRGDRLLAFEHRVHVRRVDGAGPDEYRPAPGDRVVPAGRAFREPDRVPCQYGSRHRLSH